MKEEDMLSEVRSVRQVPGEGTRRWFTDPYFDLIVWYDDGGTLVGFQLCYDKQGRERAFTWRRDHGCQHERIDAGEIPGQSRMSPVMVADGSRPVDRLGERFLRESAEIDQGIARLVYETVKGFPPRVRETTSHRSFRG
jgi:hypothetical protein